MHNKVFKLQETIIKALAHSRRLEIVNLLRDENLSVSDIYQMLHLPQANVSQHLQILRDAGILVTEKNGKQVIYSLTDKRFIKAIDLVREVLVENQVDDLFTIDLVCKMKVSSATAGFVHKYKDKNHYFCASGCLEKFKKDPENYVK